MRGWPEIWGIICQSVSHSMSLVECDTDDQSKVPNTYLRLSYLSLSAHRPLAGVSYVCMVFKGENQILIVSKSFNCGPQAIIMFTFFYHVWIQLFICNCCMNKNTSKYVSLMTSSLPLIFILLYCNCSSLFPCSLIFSGLSMELVRKLLTIMRMRKVERTTLNVIIYRKRTLLFRDKRRRSREDNKSKIFFICTWPLLASVMNRKLICFINIWWLSISLIFNWGSLEQEILIRAFSLTANFRRFGLYAMSLDVEALNGNLLCSAPGVSFE